MKKKKKGSVICDNIAFVTTKTFHDGISGNEATI